MNNRERVLIYSLLLGLLGLNGLLLLGSSGPEAYAGMPTFEDILGPVDGVELIAEDDDDNFILRNAEGRPSWGDDAPHRAHSMAFVHIGRVLNQQLSAEIFEEERESMREEIQDKESEVNDQLTSWQEELGELDPNSPEARGIRQRGSSLLQDYRVWVTTQQDQLAAKHLEQAYRELIDAVDVVADRMDIDLVYRFTPTDDEFKSRGLEQATMAIRLRPALRYPEELDITLDVMEELSLEFE
ncbi:MAG: hypothetical protein O7G85_10095 [Planctomycetota bacterium]|nr:hypothetical protein [Planctomycetota bacterium]